MSTKMSVTSAYRTVRTLIRRLPEQQQEGAQKQLYTEFRKYEHASSVEIPALLEVSSVSHIHSFVLLIHVPLYPCHEC